jgi:hypothetical protein
MPGFDQRGPAGQGPMTGRRMGRCTNYGAGKGPGPSSPPDNQEENQPEQLLGRGPRPGWGRGMRPRGMGRQNRFRSGF